MTADALVRAGEGGREGVSERASERGERASEEGWREIEGGREREGGGEREETKEGGREEDDVRKLEAAPAACGCEFSVDGGGAR